jgi:hypothetical protein
MKGDVSTASPIMDSPSPDWLVTWSWIDIQKQLRMARKATTVACRPQEEAGNASSPKSAARRREPVATNAARVSDSSPPSHTHTYTSATRGHAPGSVYPSLRGASAFLRATLIHKLLWKRPQTVPTFRGRVSDPPGPTLRRSSFPR